MQKHYIVSLVALLFSMSTFGQDEPSQIVQNYLEENKSSYGLTASDISDLEITDSYYTKSLDLQHLYVQQKIQGIPVFNALGNFAVKEGNVVYFSNNFQTNLKQRANTAKPSISPKQAIINAANRLGLSPSTGIILESSENGHYVFSAPGISQTEIPVKLTYQPINEENIILAWDLSIHALDGKHWWSVRVDAQTGNLIGKNDWVSSCSFPDAGHAQTGNAISPKPVFGKATATMLGDGSQYEVFALPVESPNHGSRSIVSEPADLVASPFGWHDTDGAMGTEFTITRGNNVWASEDRPANQQPGTSPDGGAGLDFLYPLNLMANPSAYTSAATVNLFYMNNALHDIWFQYGFDEASGNFQQTNYSGNGTGNDFVFAFAQFGADFGPLNNAVFGSPPEGQNPSMAMFTWDPGAPSTLLTINGTGALAGGYPGVPASFGPDFPTTPLTADLALVEDDNSGVSTDTYDACDALVNASSLVGKIAVIRRGECNFDVKVTKTETAGAIAVIMVNNVFSAPFAMGGSGNINIPSIMVGKSDGEAIINSLIAGNTINATLDNTGPFIKDGDLDNGIIAHEYGHGISSRLTGGASVPNCLNNEEQMGEGWSDFFGLVLTMEPGDLGTDARGIGTYAISQGVNGTGLRAFPYSTDMAINPFTYGDVQGQFNTRGSHGVGSVWATMLWDLNWALIDQYGFDPDLYNGTGGNNIAMQLVIDGLKLQPCNPGFVDGRDAILQADMQANGGANQCLIWEVFANRGFGWSASQGSSNSATDQTEAFDMPPTSVLNCTQGNTGFEGGFFQIYPNPADELVNIASHKINGEAQISVYDLNGRKIMAKTFNLNNDAQIDVSTLNTGIYVLQIVHEGKIQTEKLIVR